jgi:hypothetical protein
MKRGAGALFIVLGFLFLLGSGNGGEDARSSGATPGSGSALIRTP